MRLLTLDDLLPLDEYADRRTELFESMERYIDRHRRVRVGPEVTLVFENRQTLWFRLQEVLLITRLVEPARVQEELDVYNHLLPHNGTLQAGLFIGPDGSAFLGRVPEAWRGLKGAEVRLRLGEERFAGRLVTGGLQGQCAHCGGAIHWVEFAPGAVGRQRLTDPRQLAHVEVEHSGYRHTSAPLSVDMRQSLANDLKDDAEPQTRRSDRGTRAR